MTSLLRYTPRLLFPNSAAHTRQERRNGWQLPACFRLQPPAVCPKRALINTVFTSSQSQFFPQSSEERKRGSQARRPVRDGLIAARFFDRPGPRRRGLWPSISACSSGPRNTGQHRSARSPGSRQEGRRSQSALSIRVVDSQPSCLPTYQAIATPRTTNPVINPSMHKHSSLTAQLVDQSQQSNSAKTLGRRRRKSEPLMGAPTDRRSHSVSDFICRWSMHAWW
jgi:hypothetical protein